MIFITQLIYVVEGREDVFEEFENIAIPSIAKYNGKLLLRVRPSQQNVIAGEAERPYEIHLVQFETQEDFDMFVHDEERKRVLHLKEQSVRATLLIRGTRL